MSMKVVCEVEMRDGLPHDILAAAERLVAAAQTLRTRCEPRTALSLFVSRRAGRGLRHGVGVVAVY